MNVRTLFQTFASRFAILLLNFGIIIFTTNMWGSEGKGIISLLIADLAIVCFASNILVGSSISYFTSRLPLVQLLAFSYIWSALVSIVVPIVVTYSHSQEYLLYLMAISFVFSLLTANINIYVGQNKLGRFNVYTILQQGVLVLFLLLYIYVCAYRDVYIYFMAQLSAYTLLFVTSFIEIVKPLRLHRVSLSKVAFLSLFNYGWKSQLSAFVQFLTNRLSYYVLEAIQGISSVGIFSIGVAFSEAIWTVSRSLAVMLYSDIISQKSDIIPIQQTKFSLKLCFLFTLVCTIAMVLIPDSIYVFIFGKDFSQTRMIVLYLSPGIIAIAVSNIVGHYFAAIHELRILNIKSFVGLGVTIVGAFLLIPLWGITGACITTSIAYIASSVVLFYKFYTITPFSVWDFMISKKEFQQLWSKINAKK